MTQQTIQIIQNNQQHKSFVTPIGDFQLGWNAYVANMPLSECKNRWQERGWRAANHAEGIAVIQECGGVA